MEILFSVIIPTYNRATTLTRAIRSVVNQEYKNWELIIVDDGSTDNTALLVDQVKDQRIRYFKKPHSERSASRNYGISKSRGNYICFLDSDDEYLPNYLVVLSDHIEMNGSAFMSTIAYIDSDGKRKEYPLFDLKADFCQAAIWERTVLPICCVCVRADILELYSFDEKFNIWEDLHLWFRLMSEHKLEMINDYTAIHHYEKRILTAEQFKMHMACMTDLFDKNDQMMEIIGLKKLKGRIFDYTRYYLAKADGKLPLKLNLLYIGLRHNFWMIMNPRLYLSIFK